MGLGLGEQYCNTSTIEGMGVTRTTPQNNPATTPEACRSGTVVVLKAGVDVQLDRGIDGGKDGYYRTGGALEYWLAGNELIATSNLTRYRLENDAAPRLAR